MVEQGGKMEARALRSGMRPDILLLGPDDAPLLTDVADDVFDHALDPIWTAEFLRDPRHHMVVARDGSLVVGFASGVHYVHPDKPPELWINEVGVAGTHRRRGLGRALVEALTAHGRALGCVSAWVLTEQDNAPALALYRSAGGHRTTPDPVLFEMDRKEEGGGDGG